MMCQMIGQVSAGLAADTGATTAVVAAAVAATCGWLLFARPRRLSEEVTAADLSGITVSVIIPARDEANSLPELLTSLSHLAGVPTEVIVVDDSSTDATADIARRAGATVIEADPPPPGWLGKPWACATGAAAARAEMLVFLDADVRLGPRAIDLILAAHRTSGGLCSVQPFHRTERPHEQLSAMFNACAVLGTGQFAIRAARTDRSASAVAFGPCMITTASDYHRVGGHAAVRDSVTEDIALARAFTATGLPSTVWLGGGDVWFRMYPAGLRSLVEGWTKNIAAGARQASSTAVAATVLWIAASAATAVAGLDGLLAWLGGGDPPVAALLAWLVVAGQLRWILRRLGSFGPLTWLLFPVPITAFIAIFLRSMMLVVLGRDVRWRGRSMPARQGAVARRAAAGAATGAETGAELEAEPGAEAGRDTGCP